MRVLVDTTPLLHLFLAFYDLKKFKENTYTYFRSLSEALDNIKILHSIFLKFDVYTINGVISELFNIADKIFDDYGGFSKAIFRLLRKIKIIDVNFDEVPKDLISELGYTDACLIHLARKGFLLLTADKDIMNVCLREGIKFLKYPFEIGVVMKQLSPEKVMKVDTAENPLKGIIEVI